MRFETVKAYAFGPFRNETLELAPGMNVVYGWNEAGKSSWHAALYAGLCGIRRARGKALKIDAEFAERHKPWDDDTSWDVGAIIGLADGRRVELRHDLAGGVASSAHDVDLGGRDYANEIMFDGAPDGAQWLGLDRRSFVMTACIRQADILGLLNSPSELQDELQRAADTSDRDGTATEALTRLRDFRAEFVGSTRARTKPLMVTEKQVQSAKEKMGQAQAAHEEYLTRWMGVDELDREARDAERKLGMARVARGANAASEAAARLQQALELNERFPHGRPRRPSEDDQLERRIDSALAAWESRPDVLVPAGPKVAELEEELASVESQLEGVEASDTHQAPDDSGGLFATLFRAIRTFFASLLRLFGVGPREPSMHPERRQALEERRGLIQERITARQDADRRWEESTQRVREAADGIQEAALAAELTASSPGEASAALFEWRGRRTDRLKEIDDQMKDWDELQQILGQSSLDELAGEVERLGAEARALSKEVGEEDMADLPAPLTDTEFSHAEREASETRTAFNRAQSQLEVFARDLVDVAEAKEALDAAEDEHARVRALGYTLDLTIRFLEQAEELVHRNVAPVFAETVREWLPRVTGGRYTDCRVDPEKLAVEVATANGRWQRAELLSHGTAEQVYLLLRLALARHLAKEDCPLILDDAVAASDSRRKHDLLETLLAVSESTQVILFTHEDDVCAWARERLAGEPHRLTELDGPQR